VKAYLRTTGILFALFGAWHVYELFALLRSSETDPGMAIALVVIIVFCGALSVWAFRVLNGMRGGTP